MIETEVIRVDPERPDPEVMRRAGELIRAGELVAFPTETVYGLGGDALNPGASEKIYAAKRRPSDNPLIVHIADMEHLDRIIRELPPEGEKLARAFWPGPLTMIFHKTDAVPLTTSGGLHPCIRGLHRRAERQCQRPSVPYICQPCLRGHEREDTPDP